MPNLASRGHHPKWSLVLIFRLFYVGFDGFVVGLSIVMQKATVLWRYREFVIGNVAREFKLKYQRSMLGFAWLIIQPLSLIVVYTVIFSQLMRARLPGVESGYAYSIYLCSGIIAWGLFSEVLSRSTTVFVDQANLIKKVSFPKLCLPVIVTTVALINFLIIGGLFVLFLVGTGAFPGWVVLAVLPVLLVQLVFSVGLGISLGVLNVFFRDVGQSLQVGLQLWFWFTPIVYPIDIVPEVVRQFLGLNPMTHIVAAYQQIFVHGESPSIEPLLGVFGIGLLSCMLGWRLFSKHAAEMVDEL